MNQYIICIEIILKKKLNFKTDNKINIHITTIIIIAEKNYNNNLMPLIFVPLNQ